MAPDIGVSMEHGEPRPSAAIPREHQQPRGSGAASTTEPPGHAGSSTLSFYHKDRRPASVAGTLCICLEHRCRQLIQAGLGTTRRDAGPLINEEFGSVLPALRVSPRTCRERPTHPKDIGAEDFCANCQGTESHACPAGRHFSRETKMVRGVENGLPIFDKCIP